jgi:hypothetical protein
MNDSGGLINENDTSNSISISADPGNTGTSSNIQFKVDAAERMRIDSSGNVGIGTSSPTAPLSVRTSSGYVSQDIIGDATNGWSSLRFRNAGNTDTVVYHNYDNGEYKFGTKASEPVAIRTSNTERMRIDSSGNLLVGKTTTSNATAGTAILANGAVEIARSNDQPMRLNRLSSDGTIIDLRKDGTTVGSIGTNNGDIQFADGNDLVRLKAGKVELRTSGDMGGIFVDDTVNAMWGGQDDTIDLGRTNYRYKDLYLSGSLSDGTNTATVADVIDAANNPPSAFPSGTAMLFQQTSAPTGWTKSTTHNDKALRVVSGTASSGGSTAFSTAMGTPSVSGTVGISGAPAVGNLAVSMSGNISNTTLSVNTIPSHSHSFSVRKGNATNYPTPPAAYLNGVLNGNTNTSNAGNNGAHGHSHNLSGVLNGAPSVGNLAGSLSSATAAINVQYVDIIIATKD